MAYIGSPPAYQASGVRPRDEFTADGTQICFPLSQSVPGSFESGVTIVLDNVPQQPVEAFTVVDTRTLTLTSISGTFTVNETVTGTTSTATGTVLKVNLNNIVIRGLTGTFSSSETITGGTSTATATTTSVTINTGSGILFSEAPTAASILYVVHEGNATYNLVPTAASVGPSQLADNLRNFTVDTFTGDGTTTTFTLSDTPSSANSLLVMVDGIVQTRTTNYTLSGAVVTFTDAPDSSAAITIIHLGFSTISRTGLVDGSVTTSKIADNAITSAKLGFDVIVAEDIAANAITVAEIASGAVTTAKLATDLLVTHSLGTAGAPSITFTGDTNTGIFSPTADTIAFAEGGAEAMRIDSSGNVGIGTSSPTVKLQVIGTTISSNFYTGTGTASAGTFGADSAGTGASIIMYGSTGANPGAMILSAGSSERMRIDSNGLLMLSTTSALGRFTVSNPSNATVGVFIQSTVAGDVGNDELRIGKYDNNSTSSQIFVRFTINNAANGSGSITGNGANSAAFGSFSDERLKENISCLPTQLDNVLALRPVEFDYKDGSGHQIGFIAQEMQAIYPDTVGDDGTEEKILTITGWDKTTARLVKAIQEQQALIIQLQADVAALKGVK